MEPQEEVTYELTLTNYEVKRMFNRLVRGWFGRAEADYNDFIQAVYNNFFDWFVIPFL